MADARKPTFELGLAMAGAISAGAYSAGVLDFLFEALSEWQKAKDDPNTRTAVPGHDVVLKVISGASAGAITGALSIVALRGGIQPRDERIVPGGCVLPKLYRTWVKLPRMCPENPGDRAFLTATDLAGGAGLKSVLNCTLLDFIRDDALALDAAAAATYAFVSSRLHVYMTVSNLRGVPYRVSFAGGSYGMQSHGDRAHYIIEALGTAATSSKFADDDPAEIVDVTLCPPDPKHPLWRAYTEAALASGAFPVGLVARELTATIKQYDGRKWPMAVDGEVLKLDASFPPSWATTHSDFRFFNVDGGLINNEPFEFARYTLMEEPPKRNEPDGLKADRAVIMIDPFPEDPEFLPDGKPEADIAAFVRSLFPALKNQARFKPSEIVRAANEGIYSRFLIAPHRTPPGTDKEERVAIACGLLGGFGGFLSERFRAHDFQLGRRNCQRFLHDSFAVPRGNVVVDPNGAWSSRLAPVSESTHDDPAHVRVVPLLGSAAREVPYPEWPRLSQAELDALLKQIDRRYSAVASALIAGQSGNKLLWAVLQCGRVIGRGKILRYLKYAILSDLVRRDQIEGWDLAGVAALSDFDAWTVRSLVAELANPAFDGRTVSGLVRTIGASAATVQAILDALLEIEHEAPFRAVKLDAWNGAHERAYTLAMRQSFGSRVPIWRDIGEWFSRSSIDKAEGPPPEPPPPVPPQPAPVVG